MIQTFQLSEMDFKAAITTMFNEVKENIMNEKIGKYLKFKQKTPHF